MDSLKKNQQANGRDLASKAENVIPDSAALWHESSEIKAIKKSLVNGALAKLSVSQRQAFELVVLEGKTEEIAAMIMGCNRSSVRTHVRRAGERLRKIIEAEMSPTPDPVQIDNHRVKPAPLSDNAWSDEA